MTAGLLAAALLLAASIAWRPVAPGAEALTVEEDGAAVDLVRFDLGRFRPEVVVFGPGRAKTASALRRELGAAAAINGGFFDENVRPLGLRIARGRTVVPLRRRVDWGVLLLLPGRAEIVHSRDFRPEARIEGAIQVGPRLLAAGRPLKLKPQTARRSAVALDREGKTLTLVVTRSAMDATRLARLLARLGFHSALLLDGGASTQVSVAFGAFALDVPGAYGVPDALVVRSR
ncbi:MAG TPA: phosphodiester glycosidase family protein [Vicinamibacteria bacterium]|nr:phosphodiester glycosidase family protein [Vicinamibacteria bacterium]